MPERAAVAKPNARMANRARHRRTGPRRRTLGRTSAYWANTRATAHLWCRPRDGGGGTPQRVEPLARSHPPENTLARARSWLCYPRESVAQSYRQPGSSHADLSGASHGNSITDSATQIDPPRPSSPHVAAEAANASGTERVSLTMGWPQNRRALEHDRRPPVDHKGRVLRASLAHHLTHHRGRKLKTKEPQVV